MAPSAELSRDTGLWVFDLAAGVDSAAAALHAQADVLRNLPPSPPSRAALDEVEAAVQVQVETLAGLIEGGAWDRARTGVAREEAQRTGGTS